jgi:hypothetical protein
MGQTHQKECATVLMAAINYLSKADPSSPGLACEHELIVSSEVTF